MIIESAGAEDELIYHNRSDDPDLLNKLKRAGVSVKTYKKLEALICRMNWDAFTTTDLSAQPRHDEPQRETDNCQPVRLRPGGVYRGNVPRHERTAEQNVGLIADLLNHSNRQGRRVGGKRAGEALQVRDGGRQFHCSAAERSHRNGCLTTRQAAVFSCAPQDGRKPFFAGVSKTPMGAYHGREFPRGRRNSENPRSPTRRHHVENRQKIRRRF